LWWWIACPFWKKIGVFWSFLSKKWSVVGGQWLVASGWWLVVGGQWNSNSWGGGVVEKVSVVMMVVLDKW